MDTERDELRDELRIRRVAIPLALLVAVGFHSFGLGRFLQRAFFGMSLHELGHATAAWLCGIPAFPGPWLTPMAQGRSWVFALLISAGLAAGLRRTWKSRLRWIFVGLLAVQWGCTLLLKPDTATALVLFAGDAGAMVFGALGMASLFVPRDSPLHRGWLRWGFVAIGAAAFVDVFSVWLEARHDFEAIPFGANEGSGLSDPSRLVEEHGWAEVQLVSRYFTLGVLCLLSLAGLNLFAERRVAAQFRDHRPEPIGTNQLP